MTRSNSVFLVVVLAVILLAIATYLGWEHVLVFVLALIVGFAVGCLRRGH